MRVCRLYVCGYNEVMHREAKGKENSLDDLTRVLFSEIGPDNNSVSQRN